jgi:hypothetical protein
MKILVGDTIKVQLYNTAKSRRVKAGDPFIGKVINVVKINAGDHWMNT